jgi:hypothetical protein
VHVRGSVHVRRACLVDTDSDMHMAHIDQGDGLMQSGRGGLQARCHWNHQNILQHCGKR